MGIIRVERFASGNVTLWDSFVDISRNGIFLFKRSFMEYHADRFEDHSLLFFEDESLIGIFPANQRGEIVYSHQGLTFGGLVTTSDVKATNVSAMIDALLAYYSHLKFKELVLKPTPAFLHKDAAQEDLYFWHLKGASLYRRDLSSILYLKKDVRYSKGRKWIINKAKKENVQVRVSSDWESFHEILSRALQAHGARPVHSVEELKLLHERFPHELQLYGAYKGDQLISGAVTFLYGTILHTQYLANSDVGRDVGGLDLLLHELVEEAKSRRLSGVSFGISTTDEGRVLNKGLLQQKESYGARGVLHDWYRISI